MANHPTQTLGAFNGLRQRSRAWHLDNTYDWHLPFTDAFNAGRSHGQRSTTMKSKSGADRWYVSNNTPEGTGPPNK